MTSARVFKGVKTFYRCHCSESFTPQIQNRKGTVNDSLEVVVHSYLKTVYATLTHTPETVLSYAALGEWYKRYFQVQKSSQEAATTNSAVTKATWRKRLGWASTFKNF